MSEFLVKIKFKNYNGVLAKTKIQWKILIKLPEFPGNSLLFFSHHPISIFFYCHNRKKIANCKLLIQFPGIFRANGNLARPGCTIKFGARWVSRIICEEHFRDQTNFLGMEIDIPVPRFIAVVNKHYTRWKSFEFGLLSVTVSVTDKFSPARLTFTKGKIYWDLEKLLYFST